MDASGEVVGIVECVTGIISAYHDGAAIINRLKLKRAERCDPAPPPTLEETIAQAPEEIEKELQRGIARFGKAFQDGDHLAVIALQQITIQLQSTLLEKLKFDDDGRTDRDWMELVDVADTGRDRAITALLELRQRLLHAHSGPERQEPLVNGNGDGNIAGHMQSLAHFNLALGAALPATSSLQCKRAAGSSISAPRLDRRDTLDIAPDTPRSASSDPHVVHSALSPSRASTASTSIPTPTPDNDYLGFCKSAWKLQNGDRKGALQKSKEFNDGCSQSHVQYFVCASSKCAFAGRLDVATIWERVWLVQSKGLKFRWAFLAKSHVPQQKVKDHQYVYQCQFCVFLGDKSPAYAGTDMYLEHVATAHRAQALSDIILYKTKCVSDRVAEDSEDFDINLLPLSATEQIERRQSDVLSDELLGLGGPPKPGEDSKDSVFSNEPWNEGLSDFHWDGGTERSELE
ncbi:hypothetical protein BAUCODRAFT_367082 [Baudoinia panamericana UAMH 10762]|uniref:Uncharacterized protein n=1 Tax=Baudoinia panamericana (strain UAMH 10762) TaxID=717646 RepID=M2N7S3_BAUPA|nr:uncharacterized protein BAUCODRAFT_367082 [Baudoinia panamericana UAMH 10762]EMD00159.1 hypothetical protein BAUCODRAFT_367082 [Baudoinia panamericana UAMH 10762]